jgi:DNA-binding response OmpR family regulator
MKEHKKKLLVTEDEDAMARVLVNKFERSGFEVHRCCNGKEALEYLGANTVDVIVLDLLMPGKDGFAVLQEKKSTKNPTTPVFVLTNLGQEEALERAKSLGATDCFVKSRTSLNDLVIHIKKSLSIA